MRESFEDGAAQGRMSLRRAQLNIALKGNPTMLIWAGKQLLGQSDKQQLQHTGANGGPMEYRNLGEDEVDARIAAHALAGQDQTTTH